MILLNGKDLKFWGATLLIGAKEELLKYPKMKLGIRNESRNINGVQSDPRNRKFESRSVQIKIRLKGCSESDYNTKYVSLLKELINGKDGSGVNEITIDPYIFRLEYEDCQTFRPYSLTDAEFALTFTEPNPANRDL